MPSRATKKRSKKSKDHSKWVKEREQLAKQQHQESHMMDLQPPPEVEEVEALEAFVMEADADLAPMEIERQSVPRVKKVIQKRLVKERKQRKEVQALGYSERMAGRLEKKSVRNSRRARLKK